MRPQFSTINTFGPIDDIIWIFAQMHNLKVGFDYKGDDIRDITINQKGDRIQIDRPYADGSTEVGLLNAMNGEWKKRKACRETLYQVLEDLYKSAKP